MKSFKRYLKEDWWDDLGPEGQKKYIADHPNSEKAIMSRKSSSDSDKSNNLNKNESPSIKNLDYKSKWQLAIRNKKPEILQQLSKDDDVSVRRKISEKDYLPKEIRKQMANDEDARVRANIGYMADDEETINKLAKDKSSLVRQNVMLNRDTPLSTLNNMISDEKHSKNLEVIRDKIARVLYNEICQDIHSGGSSKEITQKEIDELLSKTKYKEVFNTLDKKGYKPDIEKYRQFKQKYPFGYNAPSRV